MRGRIRSVKPELFDDHDLWDLGQETGLPVLQTFIGLWCYADKEGRFVWDPRILQHKILPYWDGDIALVLGALVTRHFIARYLSGTRAYGVVRNFVRHQAINHREAESELPEPPEGLVVTRVSARRRGPTVPPGADVTARADYPAQARPGTPGGIGNGKGIKISDHPHPAPSPPRACVGACADAGVCACEGGPDLSPIERDHEPEQPDTRDPDPEFTPDRLSLVFQREWLSARSVSANMHTRDPGTLRSLHRMVCETAAARRMQPEALLVGLMRQWLGEEQSTKAARFPLAFFAGAWGELATEKAQKNADMQKLQADLQKQIAELTGGVQNGPR